MSTQQTRSTNVDDYIGSFPEETRETLEAIRRTIHAAVPQCSDAISYQMPVANYYGALFHYAAFNKHYSLFIGQIDKLPEPLKAELAPYEIHKATVKIPRDAPMPLDLIGRLAKFCAEYNSTHRTAAGKLIR